MRYSLASLLDFICLQCTHCLVIGRLDSPTASYYCVTGSNINLPCQPLDDYVENTIQAIQVHPDLIPAIRQHYTDELADQLGPASPAQRRDLDAALKAVDDEEARALRLFVAGKITETVWDALWREWQDRRQTLRDNLEAAERDKAYHVDNLDAALHMISKMGVLYHQLERQQQKKLLREVIGRIIVDAEGNVLRIELLPPFAYLHDLACRTRLEAEDEAEKTKASLLTGPCSNSSLYGDLKENQIEQAGASISTVNFLQTIAFPQRPFIERFTCQT